MNVYIDDKPVQDAAVESGTVEDAVRYVQEAFCGQDRMIVGVRCDGRDIPGERMADTLKKPVAEYDRVDVVTGTRGELVIDAMTQAASCLNDTETACEEIGHLLNEGKTHEGVEVLGQCLTVWQRIHDAVGKSIDMLDVDPDAMMINETPLSALISRPKETLMQIREALKNRDYVLLADVLQYEFADVTADWHRIIAHLRREAEKNRSA